MAKSTHSKTKKKKTTVKVGNKADIATIIFVAVSIFFIFTMFTDSTGAVGGFLKNIILGIFSYSGYLLPIYTLALGTNLVIEKRIFKYKYTFIWLGIFLILISCGTQFLSASEITGTFKDKTVQFYTDGTLGIGGGVLGGWINLFIYGLLGKIGSAIFYIALLVITAISIFGIKPSDIILSIKDGIIARKKQRAEIQKSRENEQKKEVKVKKVPEQIPDFDSFEDVKVNIPKYEVPENEVIIPEEEDIIIGPDTVIPESTSEYEAPDSVIEPDNQVALNLEENEDDEEILPPDMPEYEYIEYTFPDIGLLNLNSQKGGKVKEQDLMNNARKLVDTLNSFGVQVKVLQVTKGPTITRYELQPMAGIKVSKILNLSDDIALNLAAPTVRIEAPIPGKAAIGIEVPNSQVDMVSMREVIDTDEFKNHPSKLAVALGKDISGAPIVADLAKMPHLLIAGATGSGKSVCINSIITSIMYKADPNEVKLLLIDPKVVELSVYNGIPHLDIPVVTKPKKAAGALNWAVTEMMKRYDMFSESKVRDIKGYNAIAVSKGLPKMPQIVIIIDELADLMMVAPNEVEDSICRLAQLARAAGMHLVIATQRPSVNVITGIIKANIPSRIAFAVTSQIDSRTILDMAGAEKLLGKGDMLYHPYGSSKPKRIQGAFISDGEVEKLVNFVKENTEEHCNHEILEYIEKNSVEDNQKSSQDDAGDYDDLFPKALEIIMEVGQASTSMIQRKLSVGYARAGRIMDQLESRGYIGPSEGSKPRQILLTKEQYAQIRAAGIIDAPPQY